MAKSFICKMANGTGVYYEDEKSHTTTHLADAPQLLPLLKEFLSKQVFNEDKIFIEHESGKLIGHTDLVEVTDKDDVLYAKRLNRDNYTKFVKNRTPPTTTYFTFLLYKSEDDNYELASTWVGRRCPTFPDDVNATPESKLFWDRHALVFGNQAIQEGTLTTICPW
jgi:hypothetical protein